MIPSVGQIAKELSGLLTIRGQLHASAPGVVGSLLLHMLAVFLVFSAVTRHSTQVLLQTAPVVPVDIVRLGAETESPPAERKALVPQQRASRPQEEASPNREAVSPNAVKPPPEDALDARLRALARLRQPDSPLRIADEGGVANVDAEAGAVGNAATYSIRDYVMAQVLRRWTLDLGRAAGHPLIVPIRVTMKRDGTIATAAIVEETRTKTDSLYREIALGARNAVVLSSPIALPPGSYPKEMHFTLSFDTRAVVK